MDGFSVGFQAPDFDTSVSGFIIKYIESRRGEESDFNEISFIRELGLDRYGFEVSLNKLGEEECSKFTNILYPKVGDKQKYSIGTNLYMVMWAHFGEKFIKYSKYFQEAFSKEKSFVERTGGEVIDVDEAILDEIDVDSKMYDEGRKSLGFYRMIGLFDSAVDDYPSNFLIKLKERIADTMKPAYERQGKEFKVNDALKDLAKKLWKVQGVHLTYENILGLYRLPLNTTPEEAADALCGLFGEDLRESAIEHFSAAKGVDFAKLIELRAQEAEIPRDVSGYAHKLAREIYGITQRKLAPLYGYSGQTSIREIEVEGGSASVKVVHLDYIIPRARLNSESLEVINRIAKDIGFDTSNNLRESISKATEVVEIVDLHARLLSKGNADITRDINERYFLPISEYEVSRFKSGTNPIPTEMVHLIFEVLDVEENVRQKVRPVKRRDEGKPNNAFELIANYIRENELDGNKVYKELYSNGLSRSGLYVLSVKDKTPNQKVILTKRVKGIIEVLEPDREFLVELAILSEADFLLPELIYEVMDRMEKLKPDVDSGSLHYNARRGLSKAMNIGMEEFGGILTGETRAGKEFVNKFEEVARPFLELDEIQYLKVIKGNRGKNSTEYPSPRYETSMAQELRNEASYSSEIVREV